MVAALERAASEPDVKAPAQASERPKPLPNSPALVRSAQEELVRLGCFSGGVDGVLGGTTRTAIKRYQAQQGKPDADLEINDEFVSELKNQSSRVCPIAREQKKGEQAAARHKARQEEERAAARHKARQEERAATRHRGRQEEERAATRQRAKKEARPAARPEPRVRQEARVPRYSGGGGGGHGTTIGVGF